MSLNLYVTECINEITLGETVQSIKKLLTVTILHYV